METAGKISREERNGVFMNKKILVVGVELIMLCVVVTVTFADIGRYV
jgi:hypothetical protein